MNPDNLPDQPFGIISDLIHYHAGQQPEHAAVIQHERMLDYAAFNLLIDRVAAALQRDGLQPGDALAICAATSIEYAAVFLGGVRAGVAVAPLAPSSTAGSLAGMAMDAGVKLFFTDAAVATELAPVADGIGAHLIALDDSTVGMRFTEWLAPEDARPTPVTIEPEHPFNIIYSSGTTGLPKGIVQSHRMRWVHVQRGAASGYGPQAVVLLSTPLYSNTTLVSFFPTLTLGGTVVLMPKFDAGTYLTLAEKYRVTHTMLVPVQYQRLMAHPDFDKYDLSSFHLKFCTSAPFSAALKADILKRWPGGLVEYYGMTEGGGTCILTAHEHPHKLHTVGCPAPGHDIRLIDDESREVAPGKVGEVVGHSPAMMNAYHNQPVKTAEAEWHDATGKRFIRTGDIGLFDEDGFLTLLDRKKDMIISGGFNVYPSDLESVLQQHPDVVEATVVGVPSVLWGETPVAFAVLKLGSQLSAKALLEWTNKRLGKTQRLAAVEILEMLPRSLIGKVLKRELRDSFQSGTLSPAPATGIV
ncbi:MAG: acyl--CoA ligase [Glaciimonas sp.]|nr:acyl--CoA ligase [Glaciimonas sp.]